jgi:acetyl esterase/lipase
MSAYARRLSLTFPATEIYVLFLRYDLQITLALIAANVPAMFAQVKRTANIAFGAGASDLLDVYQPSKPPGAALPVMVFWHGGGWVDGSKGFYRFVGATLAQLGYVTVLPNYRVYPEVRFPAFLDDAAHAVRWVQQHAAEYGGDPHGVVLMGHSAGAHMAAMLALNTTYLERAGANIHDIAGLIGLSGPYGLTPNTDVLNTIFSAPYTPRDWQVISYASAQSPPALLLHGGSDDLVRPGNTDDLAAALRSFGVRVEPKIYPGRGHPDTVAALSVPARGRAPVLQDVASFMRSLSPVTAGNAALIRRRSTGSR